MTDYYKKQLDSVKGNFKKVCFTSDNGETNWLNLNLDSIAAIESFLAAAKQAIIQEIKPTREAYDHIYNLLVNGHRESALHNMALIEDSLADFMDYLTNDLNQPELAIKAAKLWLNRNKQSWS